MKKIVTAIALLISLNSACSQSPKNGITLISFGDTDEQSVCSATYKPKQSPYINIAAFNITGTRPCKNALEDLQAFQKQLEKTAQPATLEICHNNFWGSTCSISSHETIQATIQAIQTSSAYQAIAKH